RRWRRGQVRRSSRTSPSSSCDDREGERAVPPTPRRLLFGLIICACLFLPITACGSLVQTPAPVPTPRATRPPAPFTAPTVTPAFTPGGGNPGGNPHQPTPTPARVPGTKAWAYQTGSAVRSPSDVVNGIIYVASGANVFALNATTGTKVWKYTTGNV